MDCVHDGKKVTKAGSDYMHAFLSSAKNADPARSMRAISRAWHVVSSVDLAQSVYLRYTLQEVKARKYQGCDRVNDDTLRLYALKHFPEFASKKTAVSRSFSVEV